jgi:hypothetical protein
MHFVPADSVKLYRRIVDEKLSSADLDLAEAEATLDCFQRFICSF